MERKYMLCPRCELNYIPVTEKYCDVCKAELGLVEASFLLPDEEEVEGKLCPICNTNYCEEGEDMCIECKKDHVVKVKPIEDEAEDWVDDEDVVADIDAEIDVPLVVLDDEEETEEDLDLEPETVKEDDFEYINPDDFADDDDDDDDDDGFSF